MASPPLADLPSGIERWWQGDGANASTVAYFLLGVVTLALGRAVGRLCGLTGRIPLGRLAATPIAPDQLPPDVADYFDGQHTKIEELGLDLVGDFQLVHGPCPIFARYYAAEQRDEFAEVAVGRLKGTAPCDADIRAVTFVTVFEDGTCLQSGNVKSQANTALTTPQLLLRFLPGLEPADLLNEHRLTAAGYAAEHETTPIRYPPQQVVSIAQFYAQLQRESWQSKGLVKLPKPISVGDGVASKRQSVSISMPAGADRPPLRLRYDDADEAQ